MITNTGASCKQAGSSITASAMDRSPLLKLDGYGEADLPMKVLGTPGERDERRMN